MKTQIKNYIQKNKGSVVFGLALLIIWGAISLLSNNVWFQASVLNIPKPFDGTVMPIEEVPNALTWKGDHYTANFSSIAAKDLITIPQYDPDELLTPDSKLQWWNENDNLIRNAKIVYPVVYLGNYELDHQENVGSHLAVDIRVPQGTPVHAVANGRVVVVSNGTSGFWHYIVIEHPNVPDYPDNTKTTTLYSTYNHLSTINVREGDTVTKGDIIALSGETGTATTPHLHFQIDRTNAPWHPYWPFTSAEASSAGYSFFDAINAGLNKAKAAKYTVNPMEWVQANLNYNLTASAGTSDQPEVEEEAKLKEFKIKADVTTAYTEEKINLTVTALDNNGDILENYEPSDDFVISADSGSSRYIRSLDFEDGEASLTFTDIKAKNVVLTISDGDAQGSIELTFEEKEIPEVDQFNILVSDLNMGIWNKLGIVVEAVNSGEIITNYTPSENFSFTINEVEIPITFKNGVGELTFIADKLGAIPVKISDNGINAEIELNVTEKTTDEEDTEEIITEENTEIIEDTEETDTNVEEVITETEEDPYYLEISGETIGMTGNPITLVVKAYDENDTFLKDFDPSEKIPVTTNGTGVVQPEELDKNDFVNGVATINYLTSQEEDATINVGEASVKISFISEIKQVAAFSVEHDGYFIPNLPETITIQAVDKNGEKTPNYTSIGKVKFTLIDGKGTFNPTELTASDFKNGKTEVVFTPTDNGDVKIKAQNGAIVGISHYIRADNKGIFSDVDTKNKFAEAIAYLKDNGIISGYDDGTFRPDKSVSRVEALKMIIAGLDIKIEDGNINFPDTESPSWYSPYVATGLSEDIVAGYPDGSFQPTNNIIRAEYLKVLLEAADVELVDKVVNKPYYDVDRTEWYAKYAAFSKEHTLFKVEANKLLPSQKVTRGEVADTIYKIIQLTQ